MDCERARWGLWPPERPRLCGDEVVEARRHVQACGECRDFFEQDRKLLDALQRLRSEPAPRHVRERVFDTLARERAGVAGEAAEAPSGWRRWLALGATGVATAALTALLLQPPVGTTPEPEGTVSTPPVERAGPEEHAGLFVEDYLRRAVGQDQIVTDDPAEVVRFMARELGTPLRPLEAAGLRIERAEICLLDGRRGAMVVYRRGDRTISHYMIPRGDAEPRDPAPSPRLEQVLEGMPSVVTWSRGRVEEALVADVTGPELVDLVLEGREAAEGW